MGDVELASKPTEMAQQRPRSGGLDKTTEKGGKGGKEKTENKGEGTAGGGGGDSNGFTSSVAGAKSVGGSMVMLESIPGELHLEILRLLDVSTIFTMRLVNRYFRDLLDNNEDTIVRGCLQYVECIGPHAILLQFYPLANADNVTFRHAKRIQETKRNIMRLARMVGQTQNAKIDALYCIQHTCHHAQQIIFTIEQDDDDGLERLRNELLGDYKTAQIQHMLPLFIRLVFKTAEYFNYDFRGSCLAYNHYSQCNDLLLAKGPELLLELERTTASGDETMKEVQSRLSRMFRRYRDRFVIVHDELIRELQKRGSGLMTDPGIEIQQFLQEEDTILDIRTRHGFADYT